MVDSAALSIPVMGKLLAIPDIVRRTLECGSWIERRVWWSCELPTANPWPVEIQPFPPRYRVRRRFLFGLFTSIVPIAKIMVAELLGPEKAVIGMTFIPGESL